MKSIWEERRWSEPFGVFLLAVHLGEVHAGCRHLCCYRTVEGGSQAGVLPAENMQKVWGTI